MPILNTTFLFLILFLTIIAFGYYLINRFKVSGLKRFQLTISYLGSISAILITYNIYITIQSNNKIERHNMAYNTIKNIQANYLDPQKELLDYYPEGHFLYASMVPDTDLGKHEPTEFNPIKRKQVEVFGAIRVFQAMEDFLSTVRYDLTGAYVWINNFVMWMQSPILQKQWGILAFNYSEDTREMVDRIIIESNKLVKLRTQKGKLTHQDYDAISKNFVIHAR
jgi:hypothetical protein